MLLSALLSLFIETFSLSHRARVEKSNISTKPREDRARRKQERDYIGFGFSRTTVRRTEKKRQEYWMERLKR